MRVRYSREKQRRRENKPALFNTTARRHVEPRGALCVGGKNEFTGTTESRARAPALNLPGVRTRGTCARHFPVGKNRRAGVR